MKIFLLRFLANLRISLGFCPSCNSSAPELDTCEVCDGYHSANGDPFPPSDWTKSVWKHRFDLSLIEKSPDSSTICPENGARNPTKR